MRSYLKLHFRLGASKSHTTGLNSGELMSALGQKQTCAVQNVMSALPPKADMCGALGDVRFVPIADIARFILHSQQCFLRCGLDRSQSRPPTDRRQDGSCRGTLSLPPARG